MDKIWLGPTGRLSTGHVMDVSKSTFDRAIRDYDHLLYTKWNPKKRNGWGCWEVRRRPETKSVIDIVEHGGASYVVLGYHEVDLTHHILDATFLNYDLVRKIKSMDTWKDGDRGQAWVAGLEQREQEYRDKILAAAKENRKLMAREVRTQMRDFREALLSGLNPARIADYWDKKGQ